MKIKINTFFTADSKKGNLSISNFSKLTSEEALAIREEITESLKKNYETIYLNAKDVTEVDLSGINEIIHSNYTLQKALKRLIFVYRKDSVVEKWVNITGLDSFIDTAILTIT